MKRTGLLPALCLVTGAAVAQDRPATIVAWMQEHRTVLELTGTDAAQWAVTSTGSGKNGTRFIYIQQQVNGLPVQGAVANFAVRGERVVSFGDRLIRNAAEGAPGNVPAMDATLALRKACDELELRLGDVRVVQGAGPAAMVLEAPEMAAQPVHAQLIYQPVKGEQLHLAWDLSIAPRSSTHWWHIAVDAGTGRILRKVDWANQCELPSGSFAKPYHAINELANDLPEEAPAPPPAGPGYRVLALPVESPDHGPRTLLTDPANATASPFGWHDTDGAEGVEYTTTRGNNVHASEDGNADDQPGYGPDGGADLTFDFPLVMPQPPVNYRDAAITNLFYMCNTLHDVWYQYGFDEENGNFQEMNYGGAGVGNDEVLADAQDGSGVNNANFASPPDGESGRMQMYTWSDSYDSTFVINSPSNIGGSYDIALAEFSGPLPAVPLTQDVVLVVDDTAPVNDGCESIVNSAELAGKIALVDRGQCNFVSKAEAVQNAGAVAVVVANNQFGEPFNMVGSSDIITVPVFMISLTDGVTLKNALSTGAVNATIKAHDATNDKDGDLDNAVIAHEYGHGVSTRLTGGAADSDCLLNAEQMGEGWSDWMGLVLTMEPGDQASDARGIGTYVLGEPVTGLGIRPSPYSTDFAVNNWTYGATNDDAALSEEHGIGFVWATMLWDLTWGLVQEHGFDPDMYHGTGGNNIAMQLVMDGLKMQPCSPGFVDGRDAILLADELDFDGADKCIIWNAFAKRGLGFSADQGSSDDRYDQVEAFDLPAFCSTGVGTLAGVVPNTLSVVPNPVRDQATLSLGSAFATDAQVEILTAEGRVVRSTVLKSGHVTTVLDVSGLAPAVYQVEVHGPAPMARTKLVVVR